MYTVPYHDGKYSYLQYENGTVYISNDPHNTELETFSKPYPKINSISCNGCDKIRRASCSRKAVEGKKLMNLIRI